MLSGSSSYHFVKVENHDITRTNALLSILKYDTKNVASFMHCGLYQQRYLLSNSTVSVAALFGNYQIQKYFGQLGKQVLQVNICYLPAGRSDRKKIFCRGLKNVPRPSASGRF